MNKEQLDNLDLIIRTTLFNPEDYPNAKKNNQLVGAVFKCDFEGSGNWISEYEYLHILQKIFTFSGDNEITAIEDFERKYKSSGNVVRLFNIFDESWLEFRDFTEKTEMISFFAIGKSKSWLIWANRDFWCVVFDKSLINRFGWRGVIESNIVAFSDADEEFISFLDNLHS